MWANAQRDGRPVEYRWRLLLNAAKFGLRPLRECRAITLPRRRETRWNLLGCPKLANRSQPLVGRSSPYYEEMWARYCCLTIFQIVDMCLCCEDVARQTCAMVRIDGHKVNFARGKIPSGDKSCRKCIYSVPGQETVEHSAKFGWLPLSDVAAVTKLIR